MTPVQIDNQVFFRVGKKTLTPSEAIDVAETDLRQALAKFESCRAALLLARAAHAESLVAGSDADRHLLAEAGASLSDATTAAEAAQRQLEEVRTAAFADIGRRHAAAFDARLNALLTPYELEETKS